METQREVYHLNDIIKQQDVSMVFLNRRLKSLDVFRHSVEKPRTTLLLSSLVFESSYFVESSAQISKKNYDLLVWTSILCLI